MKMTNINWNKTVWWQFGQVVTAVVASTKLLYVKPGTSSPVSTEMGNHLWIYHLGMQPATQANSASYLCGMGN